MGALNVLFDLVDFAFIQGRADFFRYFLVSSLMASRAAQSDRQCWASRCAYSALYLTWEVSMSKDFWKTSEAEQGMQVYQVSILTFSMRDWYVFED